MSMLRRLVEAQWLERQGNVTAVGSQWQAVRERLATRALPRLYWLDYSRWLALLVGGVLGSLFMTGLLLVNRQQTVNVIVFLTAAVILPWLIKITFWCMPKRAGDKAWQQHWLVARVWWAQVQFYSTTAASLVFVFWLLATDITFVWRSTLLSAGEQLSATLNLFAWPWLWAWPSASVSEQLLLDSQLYTNSALTVGAWQSRQWWQYLLATMLVWVWLPRLVDWLRYEWLLFATVRQLEAGPLHQRLMRQELYRADQVQVQRPLGAKPSVAPIPAQAQAFYWRSTRNDDLSLISFHQAQQLVEASKKPVVVHVQAHTTPTAELADICQAVAEGWLVVHGVEDPADLLSWQQFLARYLPSWHLEQQ